MVRETVWLYWPRSRRARRIGGRSVPPKAVRGRVPGLRGDVWIMPDDQTGDGPPTVGDVLQALRHFLDTPGRGGLAHPVTIALHPRSRHARRLHRAIVGEGWTPSEATERLHLHAEGEEIVPLIRLACGQPGRQAAQALTHHWLSADWQYLAIEPSRLSFVALAEGKIHYATDFSFNRHNDDGLECLEGQIEKAVARGPGQAAVVVFGPSPEATAVYRALYAEEPFTSVLGKSHALITVVDRSRLSPELRRHCGPEGSAAADRLEQTARDSPVPVLFLESDGGILLDLDFAIVPTTG